MGSNLFLHTVNAEFVAKVACEDIINCLAYSTAPEGVSINVIAGGLSSGVIRYKKCLFIQSSIKGHHVNNSHSKAFKY